MKICSFFITLLPLFANSDLVLDYYGVRGASSRAVGPFTGEWTQRGQTIDQESLGSNGGGAVALSADGRTVVKGSPTSNGPGAQVGSARVYQYHNNTNEWFQLGRALDGNNIQDLAGFDVAISSDGDIVAIGYPGNRNNAQDSGEVHVYRWGISDWVPMGSVIEGIIPGEESGFSLDLSGDGKIISVGAPRNNENGARSGKVRVLKFNGLDWEQIGESLHGDRGDFFGWDVALSLDGKVVAVGGPRNRGEIRDAGHVRVFEYNDNGWKIIGQKLEGIENNENFGTSVNLSDNGRIVAIGAPKNNENGIDAGKTVVMKYKEDNDVWEPLGNPIFGENRNDESGFSVSISSFGTVVAVGGPYNAGRAFNGGHTQILGYFNNTNSWEKLGQDIFGEFPTDNSGFTTSLSDNGQFFAVGAPGTKTSGPRTGNMKVYEFTDFFNAVIDFDEFFGFDP